MVSIIKIYIKISYENKNHQQSCHERRRYLCEDTLTTTLHFFQLLNLSYSHIDAVVTLENNTADEAGNAVYRGVTDQFV